MSFQGNPFPALPWVSINTGQPWQATSQGIYAVFWFWSWAVPLSTQFMEIAVQFLAKHQDWVQKFRFYGLTIDQDANVIKQQNLNFLKYIESYIIKGGPQN